MRACNLLPAPGELRDEGKPTVPRAGYCPGRRVLGLGLTSHTLPGSSRPAPERPAFGQVALCLMETHAPGKAAPPPPPGSPPHSHPSPSCKKGLGPTVLPRQEQTPRDLKLSHGAAVSGVPGLPRGCGGKLPHSLLGLLKQEWSAIRPGAASPLTAEGGRSCLSREPQPTAHGLGTFRGGRQGQHSCRLCADRAPRTPRSQEAWPGLAGGGGCLLPTGTEQASSPEPEPLPWAPPGESGEQGGAAWALLSAHFTGLGDSPVATAPTEQGASVKHFHILLK